MALHGKTILTTRAAAQSAELTERLTQLGARVLECPAIEFEAIEDWNTIDAAIDRLNTYQWLMFTSVNAVDFFMKRVAVKGVVCRIPLAVVGPATAKRLEAWKLSATLIPEHFHAEGLLDVFPPDLNGLRILFPRAEIARETIPEELRRRGALVDVLPVYRTRKTAKDESSIRQILAQHKLDCAVFTSPSSIQAIQAIPFVAEELAKVAIAVIGPATAKACAEFSLPVAIQPANSTIPELVEAIRSYFEE